MNEEIIYWCMQGQRKDSTKDKGQRYILCPQKDFERVYDGLEYKVWYAECKMVSCN